MSKNSNTAFFFNNFGTLFYLLIKKLKLCSKTIWQSMRASTSSLKWEDTFPHMGKEETFFSLKTARWYGLNFV